MAHRLTPLVYANWGRELGRQNVAIDDALRSCARECVHSAARVPHLDATNLVARIVRDKHIHSHVPGVSILGPVRVGMIDNNVEGVFESRGHVQPVHATAGPRACHCIDSAVNLVDAADLAAPAVCNIYEHTRRVVIVHVDSPWVVEARIRQQAVSGARGALTCDQSGSLVCDVDAVHLVARCCGVESVDRVANRNPARIATGNARDHSRDIGQVIFVRGAAGARRQSRGERARGHGSCRRQGRRGSAALDDANAAIGIVGEVEPLKECRVECEALGRVQPRPLAYAVAKLRRSPNARHRSHI